MPGPASRRLTSPKWCPSCSLALMRAFASACGAPFPVPIRQLGSIGYRGAGTTKATLARLGRPVGKDNSCSVSYTSSRSHSSKVGNEESQEPKLTNETPALEHKNDILRDLIKDLKQPIEGDIEIDSTPETLPPTIGSKNLEGVLQGGKNDTNSQRSSRGKSLTPEELEMDPELKHITSRLHELEGWTITDGLQNNYLLDSSLAERAGSQLERGGVFTNEELSTLEAVERNAVNLEKRIKTLLGDVDAPRLAGNVQPKSDRTPRKPSLAGLELLIADAQNTLDELENELDDIVYSWPEASNGLESEEDIEYKATEEPTSPQPSTETPWYLQSPPPPAPKRFVSPLIEQMPPLPPNPPENFESLMNYLLKDLSLSKLKVMDIRGLDPPPALGQNVIMILATARSERHMNIAADRCSRYMRGILHGAQIYADGLIGRGEMKLREKRERRKGKRRTAEDEESMRVGWICVNSGQGIVVQIMTGWKREQLNLEALWSRKIHTSKKRKLKERLLAEGLSEAEIKARVAAEIPDIIEEAPEYDPEEVASTPEPDILKASEVLPPLEANVELEEYQEIYKAAEIHSKSKKPKEGKRYLDIPVKSKNRQWRERLDRRRRNEKQLRNPVAFSTKFAYSTMTRQYSTATEASQSLGVPPLLDHPQLTDLAVDDTVKMGDYREVLKMYPRPRTESQNTLVLLAHLNHLARTPPDIARRTLLLSPKNAVPVQPPPLGPFSNPAVSTPFLESFYSSFPRNPTPTHNHIRALLYILSHNISPLTHPLKRFASLPSDILRTGQQVPLITYHTILRALANSTVLRGQDHPKTVRFWTNRTSDALSVMMLYVLQNMDIAGIDVGNDPEVFESIWLAMSPRDTLDYIATLGDPSLRGERRDEDKPFSRALDHRIELFKGYHERWYDPVKFMPKECTYLRKSVDMETLDRLLPRSLVYPPIRPDNIYSTLPSYLVTMFVTTARAKMWGWTRHIWKWLPTRGVRRPKKLYALYFELLAREGRPDDIIEALRIVLTDYEREFETGEDEIADGVAGGLLACVEFVEREVPGTGLEFERWRRRCRTFLGIAEEVRDTGFVI
ncbi:hypothetical protein ABW19_dt0209064 [Dactylella cylindrospora]|nr:hypothetical protein ABW19_dt0209064 [Dactylella cylindrospora]